MGNKWQEREPIYHRSEQEAPFCPDCGTELNSLDMINLSSTCKCGGWSIDFGVKSAKTVFKPSGQPPEREKVDE